MKALISHKCRSSEGRSPLFLAMLTAAGIAALHGALADGTTDVPPSSKAVTVVSALPPPCPATAPCKLGIGKAYGDPWVSAEAGDANYFKVAGTPQLQPSEVIVTVAYGEVEVYARSGGLTPTSTEYDWGGGHVLRLPGWLVPHEGDWLMVLVNATSATQFRVLAASHEDVLQLEDGLPVQMLQDKSDLRYFSIAVEENATDLSIAIDPFYGDPDMFVSLKDPDGLSMPTQQNFTWQGLSFGGDTLHMQSEELSQFCTPDAKADVACTYVIGVSARSNCSYTIQASLNGGWRTPGHLLMGQPQSSYVPKGSFDYYALLIPRPPENDPWASIVITLTPTDGGQQDIYVTTNRTREPGPTDYDVKSTNWAGSVTVVFSETANGFCTECTIYLGVFGYKEGGYSILASQGLSMLQEGFPQQGTVGGGAAVKHYYEYFNPPGRSGPLKVVLTALTGDPDLYVANGGSVLPGPHNFHWMGGATGSDFVTIDSTDSHFCEDCAYQIGISSVSNSSFTISINHEDEGATLLVHGRPQAGWVRAGHMQYYLVRPESDTARLTVSLTTSLGQADLYMARRNESMEIDPLDDSTYSWTSKGMPVDAISAQGPGGTAEPYLIGVFAIMDVTFSVSATFSQGVSLLQAGVPQRHSLRAGHEMAFGFLVDQDNEDLQLAVTPIIGNPSLFAGMGTTAPCSSGGGDEGVDSRVCTDWTWSCTSGVRRSITISSTHPCEAAPDTDTPDDANADSNAPGNPVSPGQGGDGWDAPPSVNISKNCVQSSFGMGMMFLTVVAESEDVTFTVMASLLGKHVTLVAGIPQHAVTSPMIPCGGGRTGQDDGPCSVQYATSNVMQEALFVFKVTAGSTASQTGISLSLVPECTSPRCSAVSCRAGCPDRPAKVYVKSCREGRCKEGDHYPSEGNADGEFEVSSAHGTVFISTAPGTTGGASYCIPSSAGPGCVYYVGVVAGSGDEPPMQLSATVDSPKGALLVLPCVNAFDVPDGVVVLPRNQLYGRTKFYEICSEGDGDFQVSIETCRGEMNLFVCDDTCPNLYPRKEENEYAYMSNGETSCRISRPPIGSGEVQCETPSGSDDVAVIVRAEKGGEGGGAGGRGRTGATYFVGVEMRLGQRAEDQELVLRLDVVGEGDVPISPVLSAKTLESSQDGVSSRAVVAGGNATVEWAGVTLHTPENRLQTYAHEGEERDCADFCSFEIYAVPTRLRPEYARTQCGLASIRSRLKSSVVYRWLRTAKPNGDATRVRLK